MDHSRISKLAVLNGELIFEVYDNTGYQLGNRNVAVWKSNGTLHGTLDFNLKILPTTLEVGNNALVVGEHLILLENNSEMEVSLNCGKRDGYAFRNNAWSERSFKPSGCSILESVHISKFSTDGHDLLYFEVYRALDSIPGVEVASWKSDGTFSGTQATDIAKIETIYLGRYTSYQIRFSDQNISKFHDVYTGSFV